MVKKRSGMAKRRVPPARRVGLKETKGLFKTSSVAEPLSPVSDSDASEGQVAPGLLGAGADHDTEHHTENHVVLSQSGLLGGIRQYFLAHRRQSLASFRDLMKRPWANLLIVSMLGATLFVPLVFYATFQNADALQGEFDPSPVATVFFAPDVDHARALRVASEWRSFPGVLSVEVISKAQGMKDLLSSDRLSEDLLRTLGRNPLPEVAKAKLEGLSHDQAKLLEARLKGAAGVDYVVLDAIWTERFVYFLSLMKKVAYILVVAFSLVVVLTIANVTRLSIENQRDHIKVASLFGASAAFLRRPFLYQGVLLGLFGALISVVMLLITKGFIANPLSYLLQSYALNVAVLPLSFGTIVSIFIIACCLGAAGAHLAVRQVLVKLGR